MVVQLASRDTGLFGGDEHRHPGPGTKSEDSTALPLTRIPRRAGIAAQVVHPDLGELVHQGLADAVGGVAVHPAIVGDEGHHSLLADSIARPPEGANVGVVEAVLVRGRGTGGVGLPDPGVQGRIVQVRVVVIGTGLAGRVRRVADDHLDRGRQLPLDALIVRRDQRGVGPIPLLGDLEGVGERGTREGRVPGARSLLRGPPLGLLALGAGDLTSRPGFSRWARGELLVRDLVHPGLGEGLVRRLDVDARNVVGQQHDLVGPQLPVILARQVLGPDDPRFEQPHDERPGAGERILHVHVGVGETVAELRAAHVVGAAQDEVDDLHRRVDHPQGTGLLGEGLPEELLVEPVDDGLSTGCGRHPLGAATYRGIEGLQGGGLRLQAGSLEQTDHGLHGSRDRIVPGERTGGEQRLEHWLGDEVLTQHVNRVGLADRLIDVGAQSLVKGAEGVGKFVVLGSSTRQQTRDAGHLIGVDVHDVVGPVLPVLTLAHLLDDARQDRVLELRAEQRELLSQGLLRLLGALFGGTVATEDLDPDPTLGGLVQIDRVDHRLEPVVVGAQGIEHVPDHLEALVVAHGLIG